MITLKTFGSSNDFSLKNMALIPQLLMVTKCLFTAMKVPSKKHSFKGEDTFIKENYMLTRERVTVLTHVFSTKYQTKSQVYFKGKVHKPSCSSGQW